MNISLSTLIISDLSTWFPTFFVNKSQKEDVTVLLISKICWIFLSTIYWLNLSCYSLVTKARDTQNVKIFCETYSTKDINLKYRSIKILHPTILLNWEQLLTGYFEKSSVPFMQLFFTCLSDTPSFPPYEELQ